MTSAVDVALYATDRRTMLFIDSGYVLKSMARYYGRPTIAPLQVKVQALSDHLIARAETSLACPVLRTHWFDVRDPRGEIPNLVAGEVARVSGMKVRYGTLVSRDGRLQEKGVDALIVRDLIMASVKRTAHDLVLISGDGDLLPGVEEAQEQGARVHLWPIGGEDQPPTAARSLQEAADTTLMLDVGDLAQFFSVTGPAAAAASEPGAGQIDPVVKPPQPGTLRPTPAALDRPRPPTPPPTPPRSAVMADVYRAGAQDFPRLYDLSRTEFDKSIDSTAPHDVGAMYAVRWWMQVTSAEQDRMVEYIEDPGRRGVPYGVDRDLLAFAEEHGVDTWGPDHIKFGVRDGFAAGIRRAHCG